MAARDTKIKSVFNFSQLGVCLIIFTFFCFSDDILEAANNQPFQRDETNCPGLNGEGGWWFNRCSGILGVDRNLNAEYIQPGDTMGPYKRVIIATEWNGSRIAKTKIKIRRQSPPRG